MKVMLIKLYKIGNLWKIIILNLNNCFVIVFVKFFSNNEEYFKKNDD